MTEEETSITEEEEDLDEALGEESETSVTILSDGSNEYDISESESDDSEDDDYYDSDSDFDGDFDESGGDSGF
jgi:hypothetical protein